MNTIKQTFLIVTALLLLTAYLTRPPKTAYTLNQLETSVKISANTTKWELTDIQEGLAEVGIRFDFSESTFKINGQIQTLDLKVDCGDGHSGNMHISPLALFLGQYGFTRAVKESGEIDFKIGRI